MCCETVRVSLVIEIPRRSMVAYFFRKGEKSKRDTSRVTFLSFCFFASFYFSRGVGAVVVWFGAERERELCLLWLREKGVIYVLVRRAGDCDRV